MKFNKRKQNKQSAGRVFPSRSLLPSVPILFAVALGCVLLVGTVKDPDFWSTPDHRGDVLFRAGKFADAARVYGDPWRIGVAQYRNGDFEAAAKTFARVPGADGAFNQGNAWLMHGQYGTAISSYDRALGFQPGRQDAEANKAIALARQAMLDASGKDRDQSQGDTDPADGIGEEQKGKKNSGDAPVEIAEGEVNDEQLRATWLRRVQTTPGDFLRAKFAWQAANGEQKKAKKAKEGITK